MRNMGWKPEDIIYEDAQILVCRKHAGMAVQSARVGQMDLESALKIYREGGFVGVVQRLDQPVEGILVFGKTSQATAALNRQQQNGTMKKKYLAVYTRQENGQQKAETKGEEIRLEDTLLKDGRTNTSKVVPEGTSGGKRAVLMYRILESRDEIGLAEVTLHTGRHHQIRVQFANQGMALWGDGKYNPQISEKEQGEPVGLCAYQLEFQHPKTGKKMQFKIKPEGRIFAAFAIA